METTIPADAKTFRYQFELFFERSRGDLWRLIIDDINLWWMSDYRALGSDSTMTLDVSPSGGLTETHPAGGFLQWYQVQMWTPGDALYLTGHLAADWGGPTISMLKLELADAGAGATGLTLSEALLGNVTSKSAAQARDGWEHLIGQGLVAHARV